ncbi:alpha/beta fold hydrolase [Halopseudomonas pelagia]|uniref:Alpha/beta hydrolase n=1 Tax=Halopseudomonas pelagia TaxID=553151 RepID=A0AA91TYZ5_9GAMM|nr:alpha/beta hydrolase [Halopseudomonas pelagia]PCC97525.1 alpha/beta hydrolase [Halopseudomonas pelagia]QFY57840.1 alpha/beta hydrolase [Halopseudomonas pelagia]
MPQTEHQILDLNGIQLSLYSAGPTQGPVVWLLHGFPECWYSWRHQISALSDAGYRVFAPEMRGYGASSAPRDPAQYDLITLCGDIQAAMDLLGHTQVAMIGHDWGAPIAWHLALLEPERVNVVGALSVPFGGRPKKPAIGMIRELYQDRFHYMLYFQKPGLAEAEMAEDIPRTMRVMMHGMSGTAGGSTLVQDKPADARWLDDRIDPGVPPQWCSPEAFQVYVETFERSGFHGPVNWYRNFERNWERTEPLAGKQIEQPALFIIGDADPVGELESYTIKKMPNVVPRVEQHVIANCGHWIQCEKPEAINQLLLEFLKREFTPKVTP